MPLMRLVVVPPAAGTIHTLDPPNHARTQYSQTRSLHSPRYRRSRRCKCPSAPSTRLPWPARSLGFASLASAPPSGCSCSRRPDAGHLLYYSSTCNQWKLVSDHHFMGLDINVMLELKVMTLQNQAYIPHAAIPASDSPHRPAA